MREAELPVAFRPSGKTVYVLEGTGLVEAAAGAGIVLDQPCGGVGTCGKCRVRVLQGVGEPSAAELAALSANELRDGFRLACQSSVGGPTLVEVPATSLPAAQQKILAQSREVPGVAAGAAAVGLEGFAVAVDVGTTTLVAVLLDLGGGSELAVVSRLNPQCRFGDDVLSRIRHVGESPDGLRELHEEIIRAVNEMTGELVDRAGIDPGEVGWLALSGNTAMQQLLSNVDPSPLGRMPPAPAAGRGPLIGAAELGLEVHPRATAYLLPVIGGFVGGDTVSGILATGLGEAKGPALLVDIGTNGEIVLSARGRLSAASTAAGPAFEGARISQGMRAAEGAIEKVVVDGRLLINVIGDVAPLGLCGSALIDVAAELLRHGLLGPEGRLRAADDLPADVLPDLAGRLVVREAQRAFLLAPAAETGNGREILLTQQDVRELQLAVGAIRAGITILLRRAGLQPGDLEEVLVGGGFGNFIRRSNAQQIGLLPWKVPRERIRYRGNTSLAGAKLVAVSQRARDAAEELARRTEHVDLSQEEDFERLFVEAMVFPAGGEE